MIPSGSESKVIVARVRARQSCRNGALSACEETVRLDRRRQIVWLALVVVGASLVIVVSGPRAMASRSESSSCVLRAELRGIVNAGMASYLERAVSEAEAQQCALLVPLDTPGGMLEETRRIVRAFLDADVPVIVYVSPAAARAGSAGALVTISAHVAAMAPGSNIGAAHPVMGPTGEDPGGEELARKVENDVASLARAIAIARERNVEWAEAAVRESVSATATEALELGVIDLVVEPEARLLEILDGERVRVASGEQVALETDGARVIALERTIQEWMLSTLGNPNLAYALLMLGMLAIVFELFQPGLGVAGGAGVLLLIFGAIGLNMLPVHIGALLLLLAAFALFVAEIYVTSFGFLALAGVVCLFVGGALLVDRTHPDLFADADVRVSWGMAVPLAMVLGAAAMALGVSLARARRRASPTGAEGLAHATGIVIRATRGDGVPDSVVLVEGERWRAVSDEPLREGTPVRVIDVRGLTLKVEPQLTESGGIS